MAYQLAHYSLQGARPTNEDRIGVAERDNAVIMVVTDGLGGHRGGEIAAEILTHTLLRSFQTVRQPTITRPSAFLALGILKAHSAIVTHAKESTTPIEPRTTCVTCLVQNGYAYWAHVGDSRLYYFRNGRLLLRTQDHSTVEELRHGGILSEAEMLDHPQKGHLLNCIGGGPKPTISVSPETALQRGDMLLLCTDGLWEAFTPEELAHYLQAPLLDDGLEEMLLAAEKKMRRASDNISAICLRWEDEKTQSPALQGNAAMQINEEILRQQARHAPTTVKKAPPKKSVHMPEDTKEDREKPLQTRIQELEDFIRRFEPKR